VHKKKRYSLAFILLWLGLSLLGLASNKEAKTLDSTATHSFKALIVQANVGNLEKAYAEKGRGFMQEIVTKYFQLTAQALTENKDIKPDLVIWPESAFPEYLNAGDWNRKYSSQLRTFLQQSQITLLTGAYSHVLDTSSQQQGLFPKFKDYNALFLLAPPLPQPTPPLPLPPPQPSTLASTLATDATLQNPKQLGLYHKTVLLVFGEYIPLLEYFPWLAKYNPAGEGFSKGTGPQVLDLPSSAVATDSSWKLGVQICYESLYPEFSESLVKQGAQILINLTNDSWFSQNHGFEFMRTSSEAYQHMYMTLARAIETRRPLLRSTNTGITTAITAGGEILTQGPTQTEWFHFFEVPVSQSPPTTFYTRWGAWLMIIPFLILVLLYGAQAVRTRSEKSS
jgi:apolipoprotein N-acyltransferase